MNISRAERKELDLLSKDIFGSSGRWQKLVDKGYDEMVTEEVEETVPAEKEGEEPTKRTVKVPVLNAQGAHQFVRKYYTIESVLEFMVEQKKQLDEVRAQIARQRDELIAKINAENAAKQAKEEAEALAKQVQDAAAGITRS